MKYLYQFPINIYTSIRYETRESNSNEYCESHISIDLNNLLLIDC